METTPYRHTYKHHDYYFGASFWFGQPRSLIFIIPLPALSDVPRNRRRPITKCMEKLSVSTLNLCSILKLANCCWPPVSVATGLYVCLCCM